MKHIIIGVFLLCALLGLPQFAEGQSQSNLDRATHLKEEGHETFRGSDNISTSLDSSETPKWLLIPSETLASEALTSGILSYYFLDHQLRMLSPLYLKKAFGMYAEDDKKRKRLSLLSPLYLLSLAESAYLMGGAMGDHGSLAGALVGAWALPITVPFAISIPVAGWADDETVVKMFFKGWNLGVALAPIGAAIGYRNLFQDSNVLQKKDTDEVRVAEMLSAEYGLALADMGLAQVGLGFRKAVENRKLLPVWTTTATLACSLAVYSTGEINGSGKGSWYGTLYGGFAAPIIGAQIGSLIGNQQNIFSCGGAFGSNITATLGYNLFQEDKNNIDTTEAIGGYYCSATVGTIMDKINLNARLSKPVFRALKGTTMSVGSSAAIYMIGERWGDKEGNFSKALFGGLAAPVIHALMPPYVGINSGMDEFYIAGVWAAPITGMLAYSQFPYDDFRKDQDNDSVKTAEIASGYLCSSLSSIGMNRYLGNLKETFSDWKRSLLRGTIMSTASSLGVYIIGESFGSGEGRLVDALVGSIVPSIGLAVVPITLAALEAGVQSRSQVVELLKSWYKFYLVGSFASPFFATSGYNRNIPNISASEPKRSSGSKGSKDSNGIKLAAPILQTNF